MIPVHEITLTTRKSYCRHAVKPTDNKRKDTNLTGFPYKKGVFALALFVYFLVRLVILFTYYSCYFTVNVLIVSLKFGEESKHLRCLNPFIVECHEKMKELFRRCCRGPTLEEYFSVDEYTEATMLHHPHIYITVQVQNYTKK